MASKTTLVYFKSIILFSQVIQVVHWLIKKGNVIGVVVAKLDQKAAIFGATGTLVENVSYAIKSSYLLGFLESNPKLSSQMLNPIEMESHMRVSFPMFKQQRF